MKDKLKAEEKLLKYRIEQKLDSGNDFDSNFEPANWHN